MELVLTRLVEVLLIEALRLTPGDDAPPGLLRGLGRRATRPRHTADAWAAGAFMDRGTTREDGCAVALVILRPLYAHRGITADGIPARLAHGRREGPAPPPRPWNR
jgi:hypothetical protein